MKRYGKPPETLIIRGSQDHALVGPQPKGNTQRVYAVKGVDLFYLVEVSARFCVFGVKTGVNGGEGVELEEPD